MWRKIKQLLTFHSEKDEENEEVNFVSFQTKDPVDVLFTKNFIDGGGQFLYCENEQEALVNLQSIIDNEQIEEVVCFESGLKSFINRSNVKQKDIISSDADYAFISCEYLAAYDGAIMISSHQTKGRVLNSLPHNLIVYATPHQFVSNISEGLQKIKAHTHGNIPSITSIRGKKMHNFFDASSNAKNIYLLLVEQH